MRQRTPKDFTKEGQLGEKEEVLYSHQVDKVKKAPRDDSNADIFEKYQWLWYMKKVDDPIIAETEVLAQEFFRLLIPWQPKTRLITGEEGTFVISKHVEGFRPLLVKDTAKSPQEKEKAPESKEVVKENPLEIRSKFESGQYRGLGEIQVASLHLNEVDLKYGNVGLDKYNRVVKIDGDWCFAKSRYGDRYKYNIAVNAIDYLPFVTPDYQAYNWLDLILKGIRKNIYIKPATVNHELSHNPYYRSDVNFGSLKEFILPESYIKTFVGRIIKDPQRAALRYDEIISRREALKNSALNSASFREYVQSELAQEQLNEYQTYLMEFQTTGKAKIYDATHNDQIQAAWDELQNTVKTINAVEDQFTLTREKKGEIEMFASESSQESDQFTDEGSLQRSTQSTDDFVRETLERSANDISNSGSVSDRLAMSLNDLTEALNNYKKDKDRFFGLKKLTASKESAATIDLLNGVQRDAKGRVIVKKELTDNQRFEIAMSFIEHFPEKDLALHLCNALDIPREVREAMIKKNSQKEFNIK